MRRRCPAVRPEGLLGAMWEPDAADIDVAATHQAYVRGLRARRGTVVTNAGVTGLRHRGSGWRAETQAGSFDADVVVNAAGAWGDVVATMAGVAPVGLVPKRRTAFMVDAPPRAADWPMVIDADEQFYFKPDGSQLLCSPADETPSEPCDARPEELDVAIAIDRINNATTLDIRHVRSQWAGLRSFVADHAMVIGMDPEAGGFFWLVGQGGTGIQTAPAAARLTAGLVIDGSPPHDLVDRGLESDALSPGRLR